MIVIETDFEPDDAIAMAAHAARCSSGPGPLYLVVIVGEGRPADKIPLVRDFYEVLRRKWPGAYSSVEIVQGLGSDKEYPAPPQSAIPQDSEETVLTRYGEIYGGEPSEAFMMKPPREVMRLRLHCPRTVVHCYGSFNWRTLRLPLQDYQDLCDRYEAFYYYDSFTAIGERNSALWGDTPGELNDAIRTLIRRWNEYIIEDCRRELYNPEKDAASKARNQKVIDNITSGGVDRQFVMADVCLMLLAPPSIPSRLEAISPYPKWIPDPSSKIFTYDPAWVEGRRGDLVAALQVLEEGA